MMAPAALFVFLFVTLGSTWIFSRAWMREARAVRRVFGPRGPVLTARVGVSWTNLLSRIGGMLSHAGGGQQAARAKLLSAAGYRNPNAGRILRGIQIVSGLLCSGLALAVAAALDAWSEAGTYSMVGAAAGYFAPGQGLKLLAARRRRAIEKSLPNALDLMVICVEAGLGLDLAILQTAMELRSCYPELSQELSLLNMEVRAGKRRADALHALAERTCVEDLRKLVAVLVQTDRFGTSIAEALRNHADFMRAMARQRAEEKAAKLAIKLIFPIFFFILPSLFVVTVGPVAIRIVRDLLPLLNQM